MGVCVAPCSSGAARLLSRAALHVLAPMVVLLIPGIKGRRDDPHAACRAPVYAFSHVYPSATTSCAQGCLKKVVIRALPAAPLHVLAGHPAARSLALMPQ